MVASLCSRKFFCTIPLSVMCFNFIFRNYPQILQALSSSLSREDNPLALDNICAAIARIIVVNISAVPMDQV